MTDTALEKQRSRERLIGAVAAMSAPEREAASLRICARLLAFPPLTDAATILVYAPLPGEVDIEPFIRATMVLGRIVCLPRMDWANRSMEAAAAGTEMAELITGRHGVREPGAVAQEVSPADIEAIVVPGVGFDRQGNRLGRGAGFYDRFIRRCRRARPGVKAVGVCFQAQLVDLLPHDELDAAVDAVATESEMLVIGA